MCVYSVISQEPGREWVPGGEAVSQSSLPLREELQGWVSRGPRSKSGVMECGPEGKTSLLVKAEGLTVPLSAEEADARTGVRSCLCPDTLKAPPQHSVRAGLRDTGGP